MVTGIGIRYDMAHPGGDTVHPLLGKRVPDVVLKTGQDTSSTWSTLRGGRGVLLCANEVADVTGWTDRVDVISVAPSDDLDAATLLLRPDGHVAFADVAGTDDEGLRLALKTWFGEPAKPE